MRLKKPFLERVSRRIWREVRDIPWRLARLQQAVIPSPFAHIYRQVRPFTMCSYARLRGLYRAVQRINQDNIDGDVVECGAAHGGSAALMGLALKQLGDRRTLWVFDTFDGLPAPTSADPDYEIAKEHTGTCRGSLAEVHGLFQRLDILPHSEFVKGLFQQTLPAATVQKIALLHIDADWYDSVKTCLDQLYHRVSPGGVIQIDDYGHWQGARKAVDEFLKQHNLAVRLNYLDYSGRQLSKPLNS